MWARVCNSQKLAGGSQTATRFKTCFLNSRNCVPARGITSLVQREGGRQSFSGVIATVYGATGFSGRYVVNELGHRGSQVIVPFRGEENKFGHLKVLGDLGQIVPVRIALKDSESLEFAASRSNVVVNLVGRQHPTRNFTMQEANALSAKQIALAAKAVGVEHFVHVSALGANRNSKSSFLREKAYSEEFVREVFPDAIIIRPAPLVGYEDSLAMRWGSVCHYWPVVPVPSSSGVLQPLNVHDFAVSIAKILEDPLQHAGVTFELAGPEVMSYHDIIHSVQDYIKIHKQIVTIPSDWFESVAGATQNFFRLPRFTKEAVEYMHDDLVVKQEGENVKTIADLGVNPATLDSRLKDYIHHLRPAGFQKDV